MMGLVCLLVVLPLAWPEGDEHPSPPSELVSFDLAADVTAAALSSDGILLSAVGRNRPIACWLRGGDSWSGFFLPSPGPSGSRVLAMSPVEPMLAAGNVDGSVTIWDLKEGRLRVTIPLGEDMVVALGFAPDGNRLAVVNADAGISLVDLTQNCPRGERLGQPGTVTSFAFFPDGHIIASGGDDGSIRLWDFENYREIACVRGSSDVILSLAVSPGGCLLASSSLCERRIRLWDAETLEPRGFLTTEGATSTCLAFPADGGPLVSSDNLGNITFWDLALARPRAGLRAHKGWVKALALSQRGRFLVTGGNDGVVRVWDMEAAMKANRCADASAF